MELTIVVIGGLIGIIPGILTIIVPLIQARDVQNRTSRELKLGKEQVEFLESWLKARKATADKSKHGELESEIGAQLEHVHASLREVFSANVESMASRRTAATLKIQYARAWFLASLGFTVVGTLALFINEQDELSLEYFLSDPDNIYGVLFFVGLTAYLFYRWMRIRKQR